MLLYQHGFWENRQDNYVECSPHALTLVRNGYNDIKAISHAGVKVYNEYGVYCHQKGALNSEPSQSSLILPFKPHLPLPSSHTMLQPPTGQLWTHYMYQYLQALATTVCSAHLLTLLSSGSNFLIFGILVSSLRLTSKIHYFWDPTRNGRQRPLNPATVEAQPPPWAARLGSWPRSGLWSSTACHPWSSVPSYTTSARASPTCYTAFKRPSSTYCQPL